MDYHYYTYSSGVFAAPTHHYADLGDWIDNCMSQGKAVSMIKNDSIQSPQNDSFSIPQVPMVPSSFPSNPNNHHSRRYSNQNSSSRPQLEALSRVATGSKRGSTMEDGLPTMRQRPHSFSVGSENSMSYRDSLQRNSPPAQKRQRRDPESEESFEDDETGRSSGSNANGPRRSSATDNKASERPRLTEQEKKNNHIASEQKRRMAIREGFDRLTEIVPGLEGQGRSESIVLKKSVDYMRKALEERRRLLQRVQDLGGDVPQDMIPR